MKLLDVFKKKVKKVERTGPAPEKYHPSMSVRTRNGKPVK